VIYQPHLVIPEIPGTARKGRPSEEGTQGGTLLSPSFLGPRLRGGDGLREFQ
jgi:hypothetical protein